MALNAYLTLTGAKQGDIKGSVTQKGRENSIMIFAASHAIISPRDAASGLPSGKRMHKPFVVTKEVDVSTPLLYTALVNNEQITKWQLNFWRPSATGAEDQYFTIKLTNASISSVDFHQANNKVPDLMKFAEYEEWSFCYQKIEWTWMKGGVTALDDWESPVV
jgi:type VI secretion system secreted protein Hcp